MALAGTVVFSTVGRPYFGFDIYSVEVPSTFGQYNASVEERVECRVTDGTSVNFNGYFVDEEGTVMFVSERTGLPLVYVSRPGRLDPEPLPSIHESLFHDRPVLKNGRLYLVSNHERPEELPNCWTAVYSTSLAEDGKTKFRRLTPFGVADFSPAVSRSGEFVAVASYGHREWHTSDYADHNTDIVVFRESESTRRRVICRKGGWPTWLGDSTIFFHRQADDGWWSIYRADVPENDLQYLADLGDLEARRVTPPGVHAFTPSVSHDGKRIAVATRRPGRKFRHVEIFDVETESFHPVTEPINPGVNHYNPFFSPESGYLGYHRFRGSREQTIIPHLERVVSPEKDLMMLRVNGNCASFSPDGRFIAFNPDFDTGFDRNSGIRVVKSDGSKRWALVKDQIMFSTAWSPTERGVIFTSAGMVFDSIKSSVQIARIEFDETDLKDDGDEVVPTKVKVLTRVETGNNAFPSVSPDGKHIVFRSGRSGHKNLYVMDAVEGEFTGIRQLTDGPWTDTMPCWSPDGEIIAFSSNRHNVADPESFAVYLIRPDGSHLRRVHVAGAPGSANVDKEKINHVVFSDDSKWFVFCANLAGVSAESVSMPQLFQPFGDIFACKIDGTHLMRLTWTGFENGTPAYHSIGEKEVGPVVPSAADCDKEEGQFDELKWLQHL